jgi:nitroreductase
MNVTEAIYARRAVRAYTSRRVDNSTIEILARAAVQAPSAMNRQPWLFAVIQNRIQLERYSKQAKDLLLQRTEPDAKTSHYSELLQDPEFNIFYNASTLIVIGVAERGPFTEADCWLAAANLMLTAPELGLSTCCIGFAIPVLNTPEVKAEIGLPLSGAAVAPLIVGYPSAVPPSVPRKEPNFVSWSR